VLAAALLALQERHAAGALGYASFCDSLKAIRQDLAVQHLRGAFAVHVYLTHARLALEADDQGEFNQSQGQLALLWAEGGASSREAATEFAAYRVLYMAWMGQAGESTAALQGLDGETLRHPWVRHALAAASALASGCWERFFALAK
jgi:hypothetical protein